ncbi:MAG: TIR domain-containing protein [Rhizobiaceae bacterium]|nr:TIR domain-containing protein [Rhizobiaceae bacterium]
MGYASGFEYDLFISYARNDDQEQTSTGRGWVSEFVSRLQATLRSRLGDADALRIYFDQSSLGANHQLDELLSAARRSAIFLAIGSPSYAKREWTRKELAAFAESADDLRRLFCIEYMQLSDGTKYPDPLQSHKRARFWELVDPHSDVDVPLMPDVAGPYRHRLHDLAAQIRNQLLLINAREDISKIADVVVDEKTRREKGVVFLAQVTDDLEEERLQVQRYLDQLGYMVLPKNELSQDGQKFKSEIADNIRQADLFVQLLGPRPGRRPPDLPEGYPRCQFAAAEAGNLRRMLWRHPDLDLGSVPDYQHQVLLNDASVSASGLESFKSEIRRALDGRPRPDPGGAKPPPASTLVFINADESDHDIAKMVQQEFSKRNLVASIPMYERSAAAFHDDLKQNLVESDVLVFLYGRAPETWVRQQLRLFSKLRPGAQARTVALLVGPPDGKSDDIGVMFPDLKRVDVKDEWKVTPILEMVEALDQ